MFKSNKPALSFAFLFFIGMGAAVHAQTIEEIAAQARAKQLQGGANITASPSPTTTINSTIPNFPPGMMQPPAQESTHKAPKPVDMVLTGIYNSSSSLQAGIDIGGSEIFVGVGAPVVNHWVVAAINDNQVILKRCVNSNRCEIKTLSYTNTR